MTDILTQLNDDMNEIEAAKARQVAAFWQQIEKEAVNRGESEKKPIITTSD
ncbi:hypothetical protein HUG15_00335 [Salicibibacter cibarius]|uniref:Uncharacterized protein n=1 Tax=Salicibibacter cibarius TaxID=2743000 RepID=A0A7T6Z0L0_9BACI|nr:hypothetical protein [Salicibibacter cibarius]QQK74216.1 hypothetical protein HUG15_00335 [Salicibibacter cibarius]